MQIKATVAHVFVDWLAKKNNLQDYYSVPRFTDHGRPCAFTTVSKALAACVKMLFFLQAAFPLIRGREVVNYHFASGREVVNYHFATL